MNNNLQAARLPCFNIEYAISFGSGETATD